MVICIVETYDHGHLVPDSSTPSRDSWMAELEHNSLQTDSGSRRATMADIVVAYATVPGMRRNNMNCGCVNFDKYLVFSSFSTILFLMNLLSYQAPMSSQFFPQNMVPIQFPTWLYSD